MRIKTIAVNNHKWVKSVGWHNKTVLEMLALIGAAVGKAATECRVVTPTPKVGERLADIILRTLDLAECVGVDIEKEIRDKMVINKALGNRGRLK